jgi:hypothetical protein
MKKPPVQWFYTGSIAYWSHKVNQTGRGPGSVFYRSDRQSGPVQITMAVAGSCGSVVTLQHMQHPDLLLQHKKCNTCNIQMKHLKHLKCQLAICV